MVPGWIAGQYPRDAGTVDLEGLAKRAGVQLVLGRCSSIDPERSLAARDTGDEINFDIASIDTGGVGRAAVILGDDPRILDVRPIDGFVDRLKAFENAERVAIVGGGAAGVELAFGLRNSDRFVSTPEVSLIAGADGLLPRFSEGVRRLVTKSMHEQEIALFPGNASIDSGQLFAGETLIDAPDLIIAALGSAAPEWPRKSGLECDQDGFIAVGSHLRTLDHEHIFAVGDIAARQDRKVPHSGVHAVMAGPALAANLRREAQGLPSQKSYNPRPVSLYLLSTGDGSAILSYGPLAAKGRWVARLKHWIDNRWISQYADLAKGK